VEWARGDVPESSGYHRSTMRDQLSLRLEPDVATLPNLPATLRPMLPRPLAEPFDSTAHLFEPSWGGLRALAFIGPAEVAGSGDVRLFDGEGRDVAPVLSELAGLAVRIDARSAVLDGELVVVDAAGRADADELARRLTGGRGRPVAFLAFDLLHIDGRSLLSAPLDRRREQLRRVLRPGDEVVAVPAIAGEGRALHEAAAAQGIAGVMARQRSSPYLPGVRSRLWRFIAVGGEAASIASGAATTRRAASAPGATAPSSELDPDLEGGLSTPASAPVVALIRRLPLLFDD
jgi:bifunctional non-homologous end joining protein LigD